MGTRSEQHCAPACRKNAYVPIINPNWDFEQLGVGGLDAEFSTVFRRAFASRVFPPEVVQQLGTHSRIISYILYMYSTRMLSVFFTSTYRTKYDAHSRTKYT